MEKIKVEYAEIISRKLNGKNRAHSCNYYEIKYRQVGKDYDNIGFGSYYRKFVEEWKELYFEIVGNKENDHDVIQEDI